MQLSEGKNGCSRSYRGCICFCWKCTHLPSVLEEIIRAGILEYKIEGIGMIISVDFSDVSSNSEGIHVFIEADPVLIGASFQDLSTTVRASLRNHVEIKQIVYSNQVLFHSSTQIQK